jgi:hypothetical protein
MKTNHELISRNAMPVVTGVAIVCGNCCGDAESPRITFETVHKTCAGCDGTTYVVASLHPAFNAERMNRNDELDRPNC